jgi:hypothetical protein
MHPQTRCLFASKLTLALTPSLSNSLRVCFQVVNDFLEQIDSREAHAQIQHKAAVETLEELFSQSRSVPEVPASTILALPTEEHACTHRPHHGKPRCTLVPYNLSTHAISTSITS